MTGIGVVLFRIYSSSIVIGYPNQVGVELANALGHISLSIHADIPPTIGEYSANQTHKWVVRDSNCISFIGHIWIQLILIHNPYQRLGLTITRCLTAFVNLGTSKLLTEKDSLLN